MEDTKICCEVIDLLGWCIENRLLPKTEAMIKGIQFYEKYNPKKYECVISDILNYLLKSKNYEKIDSMYCNDELEKEIQKDDNINEAMRIVNYAINIKNSSGTELFHSILGDAMDRLRRYRISDIISNKTLLPFKEFILLSLIRHLMDIIVLNYIKKVENECNNVQLGKKWVCGLQIDAELKHLMRNGSISGLYNRIKFLAESSSAGKHRDMNNSVVKLTLVDELPKLKRSRQVVFCRILSFVSKRVTNECRDGPILDLLCGCIIDSGVKELYYDDYYLVYRLLKIGGNAGKTCLVLKLGTYTYTNEECDFESLKTEMSFIHYCQRINMTKLEDSYRLSALMFPNRGLRKH